jgi:hypothetical protein
MRQSNKKSMKKAKYPNFIFIRSNHTDPDTEDEPGNDNPGEGGSGDTGTGEGGQKPPPP